MSGFAKIAPAQEARFTVFDALLFVRVFAWLGERTFTCGEKEQHMFGFWILVGFTKMGQ